MQNFIQSVCCIAWDSAFLTGIQVYRLSMDQISVCVSSVATLPEMAYEVNQWSVPELAGRAFLISETWVPLHRLSPDWLQNNQLGGSSSNLDSGSLQWETDPLSLERTLGINFSDSSFVYLGAQVSFGATAFHAIDDHTGVLPWIHLVPFQTIHLFKTHVFALTFYMMMPPAVGHAEMNQELNRNRSYLSRSENLVKDADIITHNLYRKSEKKKIAFLSVYSFLEVKFKHLLHRKLPFQEEISQKHKNAKVMAFHVTLSRNTGFAHGP